MLCFYALPSPAQDILTQAAPAAYEQAWLTVYPQVKVNGSIRDGIEPFMSRNGVLYARPESLRAYGIALPDAEAAEAGKNGVVPEIQDGASTPGAGVWFELSSIHGLQAKYDAAAQTLDLTAPPRMAARPENRPNRRIAGKPLRHRQTRLCRRSEL
jgi:putative type 1 pili usher protein csuD